MEKNIHRLWLGPKEMPDDYKRFGEMWQELNPDWQVIEWTKDSLPKMRNQGVLDTIAENPRSSIRMDNGRAIAVQQADVIAYDLLYQFGGVYTNCDIEPFRPMSDVLDRVSDAPWATHEDEDYLVNAIFGGQAGDPFWDSVITTLPMRYFENPSSPMEWTTGPHLLTECVRLWREEEREFVGLPTTAFNYTHFKQIEDGGDASAFREEARAAGCYGLHHWGHRRDQGNY